MPAAALTPAELQCEQIRVLAQLDDIDRACLEAAYRLFDIKGEPMMTRFLAEELGTAHWFDISNAKRDLGYTPRVTIDEGLKRLGQWLGSRDATH